MFKTVALQGSAVLAVAVFAGLLSGAKGFWSVLAGGAAYLLPSLVFVLRLRIAAVAGQANAAGFLVGEAVKLGGVIVLLVWLPRLIEVNWPAFIAGLFVVLFANLFALLIKT
jgi:ATP synthase protein I